MCQATSNRCENSSVQTAEHILQERPLLRRHCSMSDISSEDLLENLLNIDSWWQLALYCAYERKGITWCTLPHANIIVFFSQKESRLHERLNSLTCCSVLISSFHQSLCGLNLLFFNINHLHVVDRQKEMLEIFSCAWCLWQQVYIDFKICYSLSMFSLLFSKYYLFTCIQNWKIRDTLAV